MSRKSAWKDHSSGEAHVYDFSPPSAWTTEQIAEEIASINNAFSRTGVGGQARMENWERLVQQLPPQLRTAIAAELAAGNRVVAISSTDWPSEGSIVVTMSKLFSVARHTPPTDVTWTRLNDPHYWRQHLSQKVGDTEHLVIA